MLIVLVPAHNEGTKQKTVTRTANVLVNGTLKKGLVDEVVTVAPPLLETLKSLRAQTAPVDRIVVIADNCTDDTVEIALEQGVVVFTTIDNQFKKAGGLNQWLDKNLSSLDPDDQVMVMDADSVLDPDFVKNAQVHITDGYHAVGGVFRGKPGGGLVGMLQRNEYARYARDVQRKNGKTLVLTGTATIFTVACLKHVVEGRKSGQIPGGIGGKAQVYDTKALTEDNELTFALLHLGYKIIAPAECGLKTEVMETWPSLWRQRERWKRGAIENNAHYGFTRVTAKYWGLQVWGFLGILATLAYLGILGYSLSEGNMHFRALWLGVTVVYIVERFVTVHRRGWRQMLISALLVVEMPYDLLLQAVYVKALGAATFRTPQNW
jgi:biofilm PGA synthesis N-glycosyltransferase PgaC